MRALVLALNPSIDVEWRVPRVRWEEKNEVLAERRWPGGKGVNVARWFQHVGGATRLLIPLGGITGRELAGGLRRERLSAAIIPLRETTRANVIVTTKAQGQLRLNPPGPTLGRAEWGAVLRSTARELLAADVLILSGSLPRGVPGDAYAQLLELGHRAGVRALLDCDGPSLTEAVKARPFLVKPNVDELARWRGGALRSAVSIQRAAAALSRVTGGYVMVSLGAGGAALIHHGEQVRFTTAAPRVRVRNTVGAGDALLAAVAFQIVSGASTEDWLRAGVGAGTAATSCLAGELPAHSVLRRLTGQLRAAGFNSARGGLSQG